MNRRLSYLVLGLLAAANFTTATLLHPLAQGWARREGAGGILEVLMGDGRRLFANHFFVKADVSFHGGYYPSIFDQAKAPKDKAHLTQKEEDHDRDHAAEQGHGAHETDPDAQEHRDEHERAMVFLGPPRDWIEKFGRNFMITEHKHLEGGKEREMLPWLRISAELDPHHPETYTVAAFWLRDLKKYKEAEAFLREGLRNNPDSYEIYLEFGRLCYEDYHDAARARNLWELALRKWDQSQARAKEPDLPALGQIAMNLARLEEEQGRLEHAIALIRIAKKASPHPEVLDARIQELQAKIASGTR